MSSVPRASLTSTALTARALRALIVALLIARWPTGHSAAQAPSPPPSAESTASPAEPADQSADETEDASVVERLLDREPFDRITLNAANDNAQIETVLLDLPNRTVPNPLPTEGILTLRRLSHPSIPYELDWSAIVKIELYEQLLLAEAEKLTGEKKFAEAFDYYAFLSANYRQLPGLEANLQAHLWREASAAYAEGKYDAAWPVLHALYTRNPEFPRLASAVQAVSDDLVKQRIEQRNFAGARTIIDALEKTFSKLSLTNIAEWRQRFKADARQQLEVAQTAFAAREYSAARRAITQSRAIWPGIDGGDELWKEIQASALEIRVGVCQFAEPGPPSQTPTWAAARVGALMDPGLIAMKGFGAEGGVYSSRWCQLTTSDDGLQTTLRLTPEAAAAGVTADVVALRLAELGDPHGPQHQEDFASLVDTIRIAAARDVIVRWQRPHVRPRSLLRLPLRSLATSADSGLWFEPLTEVADVREQRYERRIGRAATSGEPRFIVEQIYDGDEQSLEALARGDVDVLDRVPPWLLDRLEQSPQIAVAPYRMPTIHVLVPNFSRPLIELREFRRALEYGIDSESIVRDLLLGGADRPGFRALSGPFPAGASVGDPVGYAYNPAVAPRPYEPRLAALLAAVARETLTKRQAEAAKAKAAATGDKSKDAEQAKSPSEASAPSDDADEKEKNAEPPEPLILAHGSDPIARVACQSIKLQLDTVGIPIKLQEFRGAVPSDGKYDLLYAELALFEPVVEARRLLGRRGVAFRSSPLMSLALDDLSSSENWNKVRSVLHEIHRIAHYDLTVIPLWQTPNYYAYRKSLSGIGDSPVTLYQDLPNWRKAFE